MTTAHELARFRERLGRICGQGDERRPFVCEGSPLSCEVFIVGTRPATRLRSPFWRFWEPGYGFRKRDWLAAYRAERVTRQSADGARGRDISNTRRVIEWICDGLRPLRCLETSVAASPGEDDVLGFLLDVVRPRAILVHGTEAHSYLEQRLGQALALWQPRWLSIHDEPTLVMAVPSFARGFSRYRAGEAARLVRESLVALA